MPEASRNYIYLGSGSTVSHTTQSKEIHRSKAISSFALSWLWPHEKKLHTPGAVVGVYTETFGSRGEAWFSLAARVVLQLWGY